MTHLQALLAVSIATALACPVAAEIRDGERYLASEDEAHMLPEAALMQRRAIELGFFHWPAPTVKVEIDQTSRPHSVSKCEGHSPEYVPMDTQIQGEGPRDRDIRTGRVFTYEFMAYRNAITAQDCSCDSLRADWPEAVAAFKTMSAGVENRHVLPETPRLFRTSIKNDFERMCDVRMQLILE